MPIEELMTYDEVKKMFGWSGDTSVKRAIAAGHLTRVFLNKSSRSARITAASVQKRLADITDKKDAMQFFEVSKGRQIAWDQAKAHEDEAKRQAAIDPPQVAKNIITIGDLGEFATCPEASPDPISGAMTPPGCYRDETDTLVFGLPSPRESQRIFIARCKMRGIRPAKSLYVACILDGKGRFRVNDVPEEKQSKPPLEFTKPMGTAGGV